MVSNLVAILLQTKPEPLATELKVILDAVHASLKQEPRDGKFGMTRVLLPHNRPLDKSILGQAWRKAKKGYRLGVFSRPLVKMKPGVKPIGRMSWYMGDIPTGVVSRREVFSPDKLQLEVIDPAVKRLNASAQREDARVVKTSVGWKYDVVTRKVFATGPSCLRCHNAPSAASPIAIIGVTRTPWPPTKAK